MLTNCPCHLCHEDGRLTHAEPNDETSSDKHVEASKKLSAMVLESRLSYPLRGTRLQSNAEQD
jgi:hypothetical protein